ncbi:MAG: hypothetical protein JWR19_2970 [Pedosphaera sp.]|nr:hypothetical protein [Pedosphaera sp.]
MQEPNASTEGIERPKPDYAFRLPLRVPAYLAGMGKGYGVRCHNKILPPSASPHSNPP